ncbi:MAG: UDP-N-acetylmuramate dehydrogenase [Planctomycetaceae bacterium]|nr:UDP-N-acetylmuramate dehydrogenase [Planctomycetaceae bacterium]
MTTLDDFKDIVRLDEPLAPLTWLKVGGPAQYFFAPRSAEELEAVVKWCNDEELPLRLLGGGSNVLVREDGVPGAVIQLTGEGFSQISVDGTTIRAGGGALLSRVVSQSVAAKLAGLETLVGIPGTVGGALHGNAGGRQGDIGQFVKSVSVLTAKGEHFTRTEDELSFSYRRSSINELCILSAEFQLTEEDPTEIDRRMRTMWIMKKAAQPFSFQSAGCIFKNPRGLSAGALIEQAGLKATRIGACEVSDRHANFIVTHEGATSADVLRLIDLIRSQIHDTHGIELELEIDVW